LVFAYRLLGAGWLIMNTAGALHLRAVEWVKASLWFTAAGVLAISVATHLTISNHDFNMGTEFH